MWTDTYVNVRDACVFLNCVVAWHLWKNLHSQRHNHGACLWLWLCRVFHSCIDNQLHSCSTLLRPGTFPLYHHRRMHTYIHACMHTYLPTYRFTYTHTYTHTYIHTYIPTILPSRSFITSFVFPSFPVPAKTIEAHFRKKLTCGVIRSFNLQIYLPVVPHKAVAEVSEIGNL